MYIQIIIINNQSLQDFINLPALHARDVANG